MQTVYRKSQSVVCWTAVAAGFLLSGCLEPDKTDAQLQAAAAAAQGDGVADLAVAQPDVAIAAADATQTAEVDGTTSGDTGDAASQDGKPAAEAIAGDSAEDIAADIAADVAADIAADSVADSAADASDTTGECGGTVCNDSNPCTDDSCDAITGCQYVFNAATCNDSNPCTSSDLCSVGVCKGTGGCPCTAATAAKECDDNNPCTKDSCGPTGTCTVDPKVLLGAACSDGQYCTANDTCDGAGTCVGLAKDCSAVQATCLVGVCDETKDACVQAAMPSGAVCDDGNTCTTSDLCVGGKCQGNGISCADGNTCTDDSCAAPSGCVFAYNTKACDDGNICTSGDSCGVGVCNPGAPAKCDDTKPCTTDSCNSAGSLPAGCVYLPNKATCDDGNGCTTSDQCADGNCAAGPATSCDDGNPCTTDGCTAPGGCVLQSNKNPCDDGNACTKGDVCALGSCTGLAMAATACTDNNVCTSDSCSADKGCIYANSSGQCNDNNACTAIDTCVSGQCQGTFSCGCTSDAGCNDNNACTKDSCVATKCINSAAPLQGVACNDGNACTTGDACNGILGACLGLPIDCSAVADACNSSLCDIVSGKCQKLAKPNGTLCNDGLLCTAADSCTGGVCTSKATTNCDDKNPCTLDTCNTKLGCQQASLDGQACNDGSACTQNDVCASKLCKGVAILCNDGNVCTADSCDPSKGCKIADATGACDTGTCTAGDTCSKGSCASSGKAIVWSTSFGGVQDDWAEDIVVLPDGSLAIVGITKSMGAGLNDVLLVRTDAYGKSICQKTFGGTGDDNVYSHGLALSADGKTLAIAGSVSPGPAGGMDGQLLGVGLDCSLLWTKTFGGAGDDAFAAVVAHGGGFAVVGTTPIASKDNDMWLVRTDSKGVQLAGLNFGGALAEAGRAVAINNDGSLLLGGATRSKGQGGLDGWTLKLDGGGAMIFDLTVGGFAIDDIAEIVANPDGGSFLFGRTESKGAGGSDGLVGRALGGLLVWERTFGGAWADYLRAATLASKGVLVAAGRSTVDATDSSQGWLLAIDITTTEALWERKLGGEGTEFLHAVRAHPQGGLVAVGGTTSLGAGKLDLWVMRTDAFGHLDCPTAGVCVKKTLATCTDGNACTTDGCDAVTGCTNGSNTSSCAAGQPCTVGDSCANGKCAAGAEKYFATTLGSVAVDSVAAIVVLPNGGFAMAGHTEKSGKRQLWLTTSDAAGNKKMDIAYSVPGAWGGVAPESYGRAIVALADGGVAVAGEWMPDSKAANRRGLLVRFNANGGIDFQQQYGTAGTGTNVLEDLVALPDGGFACAGVTTPSSTTAWNGWLLRVAADGAVVWSLPVSGASGRRFVSLTRLADGGFAGAGLVAGTDGHSDGWLTTVNAGGTVQLSKGFGGSGGQEAYSIAQTPSGSYLVAGRSGIQNPFKAWLIEVDASGIQKKAKLFGSSSELFGKILMDADGGRTMLGMTSSATKGDDLWLVHLDAEWNVAWQRTLGGPKTEFGLYARGLAAVPSGGYVIGATTESYGAGGQDGWLVRVDAWGNWPCGNSGTCAAVAPATCDDANPCTIDLCAATTGCSHQLLAKGSICGTGNECDAAGQCIAVHPCDSVCGKAHATYSCFCDVFCKIKGDCCSATGVKGSKCLGSTCANCNQ